MKKIYSIILMISVLTLALIASTSIMRKASAQTTNPVYMVNPAIIEVGPGPAVNQTFTFTLELDNVDATNTPTGIAGIEVHLNWNSSLIEPVSFTDLLGSANGVFNGTDSGQLLSVQKGFYTKNQTKLTAPPYTNAYEFAENVASQTGTPWWGNGTIAGMVFQLDQQPQPFATCPITYNFTDLVDISVNSVTHDISNATVLITSLVANSENVTTPWVASPFTVGIATDSNLTAPSNLDFSNTTTASIDFNVTTYDAYTGSCNVTVPNDFMWNTVGDWTVMIDGAPPVSPLSDVVTYDSSNAYIYVNFTSGTHIITLTSTNFVPEFPMTGILLVLMATTLLAAAAATTLRKRKLHF